MYTEKTLKYFRKPKFAGEMKNPDAVGEEGNVRCGDVMRIYLRVKDGVIKDIRFLTYGCIGAISSSEAMCRLAKGKTLNEALKISHQDIIKELGGEMPPLKVHCSVLGRQALQKAIENYKEKFKIK